MKLFSFKGGVHPPENKEHSEGKKIEVFQAPKKVYLPLLQHIGTPLDPVVAIGDIVKIGQKVGDSKAQMAVPVHSPVSGKVTGIEIMPFPLSGFIKTIIIENDGTNESVGKETVTDYKKMAPQDLLTLIRERGIVGQGGATFPTHIKLNPPANTKIDTLVINGAECEPYLNADNRTMIEFGEKVVEGVKIALHILKINKAVIAIENNKSEAIEKITELTKGDENIDVAVVATKYPQGGEKQLIKAVLNRTVPCKKLPAEVGVVVLNAQTAKAIFEGVIEGKPLIERVLTVSGKGIKEPKNLLVKIGTQFKEILEAAGYEPEKTQKLVMGGPMMGIAQYTDEIPVIKGTSGILALSEEEIKTYEPKNCIRCGRCVDVCPMKLVPLSYANHGEDSNWEAMEKDNLMDCIECGSCAYICPANRPLTEAIKIGKAKIRAMKK